MEGQIEARYRDAVGHDLRCMKIFAVAMIRNDSDIILPFLQQCAALFDKLFVADIQSTDGTGAALRGFLDPRLDVQTYIVDREEKYQGALMDTLSREAFAQGADWVFFLDTDEFLDIPNRAELERYLHACGCDVLLLPWVNLVPSQYGDFTRFDPIQAFHWSGRTSKYTKVALSSVFAAHNPDYCVAEGNHTVSPAPEADPIWHRPGLPLLHVPIRSMDRFRVKISSSLRVTLAKHNRRAGEGVHVEEIDKLLGAGSVGPEELNYIAANYGDHIGHKQVLDPIELGWPVKRLPDYLTSRLEEAPVWHGRFATLSETLLADAGTVWDRTTFSKGAKVFAAIEGGRIRIVPQPTSGGGGLRHRRFAALGSAGVAERPPEELLIDVVSIACMRINAYVFSAWSDLIPIMYALFTVLRPRRFVELGVHNGMSFFAACQVRERLGLSTECIAVDSWVGDEHAGFHDTKVFDDFRAHLRNNYPDQHYIQANFSAAQSCFEDGSIDLLHIDGLHTYEAVKEDFETWLPRMSDVGVVIFHDINVFERGFGVWRLWEELKLVYPAFGFSHQHGLGIIFVGSGPHFFADLLRTLAQNRAHGTLAQAYFGAIGALLTEHRSKLALLEEAEARLRDGGPRPVAIQDVFSSEGRQFLTVNGQDQGLQRDYAAVRAQLDAIMTSTSWRATRPLRAMLQGSPKLARLTRRSVKLSWWIVTGQLPRRLRERRAARG